MSFISKVREALRNKTREEFCAHLQSLGIDAQLAPRGSAQEKLYARSLGVIDIVEGPIRWVNVLKASYPDANDDVDRYLVYGVPDPKIQSGFPKVGVESVSVRNFPLFGRFIGVRWKGEDFGLGIVEHISQNIVAREFFESTREGSFEIRACPDWRCWILKVEVVLDLSKQEWDSYQSIARHLLGTPPLGARHACVDMTCPQDLDH